MGDRKIYWHLPGFCVFFYLNQIIVHLMQEYPEKFMDGYAVGSVYGTFPGAIWNGGRAVFGLTSRSDMEKIIGTYNRMGVPVRFTWTNSLIEEKHLQDTYCNLIMEVASCGPNQVLVNRPVLEEYLRANYPGFEYISSTTKRITDMDRVMEELQRDYALVVLDYDLNHDEAVLKALEPHAERIEILVDEICFPGCPRRAEHYRAESECQLRYDKGTPFPCPNRTKVPSFEEAKKRPAFLSREELPDYIDRGFVNFKIVGRGLPMEMVLESYLYYLPKEEERSWVKNRIEADLTKMGVRR
jgi:collagenase-like PrtC family protease